MMRLLPNSYATRAVVLCAGLCFSLYAGSQDVSQSASDRASQLNQAAQTLRSVQEAQKLLKSGSASDKAALDAAVKRSAASALTDRDRSALDEATAASKSGSNMPLNFSNLGKGPDIDPAKIAKQFEALNKPGAEVGDGSESPKEVIVFASLSIPKTSLERMAKEAASIGLSLQFRGLSKGIGPNFYKSAAELDFIRRAGGGADLNPDLFKQYDIRRVPAYVVSANPKSGCTQETCQSDAAVVYGDVSMLFAMNVISKRNDSVGDIARRTVKELENGQSRAAKNRPIGRTP